ncbi:Fc receptor-like protein 4 [Turdus rufiventris]|nr:Fc receptor-like protein 4 [Turdus rufiventris]
MLALAGWCPLSPAGAQTPQLLVEPPWMPVVLWDWVTLTCQGSGTASNTNWYKNGEQLGQEGPDSITVTESGTYQCERPWTGLSPPVTVSNAWLVLQVPARALLEGDTVTLRCRGWQNNMVTSVSFYRDGKEVEALQDGTELSLSPLQLNHSGHYHCSSQVYYWSSRWVQSAPLPVTMKGEHPTATTRHHHSPSPVTQDHKSSSPISFPELFSVPVLEGPPEVPEGSPLNLSYLSTPSPLRPPAPLLYSFYRDRQLVGGPQGSPHLLMPAVGVSHSGNYSCQVRSEGEAVWKNSARLGVTVRMPVANATIIPGSPALQVCPGDPVTLRCSVQVGSAPVTFIWLHNGHQVAQGPLLELGAVHEGHLGTYQCVATNQLGQDGHRVFRALSPKLALEVTPQGTTGHLWNTVAVNVGRTLLYLLLLLTVIGGCCRWHH